MASDGGGFERITRQPGDGGVPAASTWWDRYRTAIEGSMTPSAVAAVEADCGYLVDSCVFEVGSPGPGWPASRVRRGLVMGSVQSGKTASMLGVAARCLDRHVDMIVLLAGTRLALWRQTFQRVLVQLDGVGTLPLDDRVSSRLLVPEPDLVFGDGDARLDSLYSINLAQAIRARQQRRPIVAVVMKNVHHLNAFRASLHEAVYDGLEDGPEPFHVVVLDDEADDASILDARLESSLDPFADELKQVPRSIVDLWSTRPHRGVTLSNQLYVTYVAYTATPQANLLQEDYSPLAPSDFVAALRTPFDAGELTPRSVTYREPAGIARYYTGGEVFYRRLPNDALCQRTTGAPGSDLADALRAYLVAAAIRLQRAGISRTDDLAGGAGHPSREEALRSSPPVHSMLIHPSAAMASHFDAASAVVAWGLGCDQATAAEAREHNFRGLGIDGIVADMSANEPAWRAWIRRYRASSEQLQRTFDLPHTPPTPSEDEWPTLSRYIAAVVAPRVRVSVVNSDPRADDRPSFEPTLAADGSWSQAADLMTIFVSGNVMSRGLTLEGLTTTLFLREADAPYADTQMQMQRWFGYRGSYLELCRIFVSAAQLDLFRAYHESDEALRRNVIDRMNESGDRPVRPSIIQGRNFAATGKLTNVSTVPLCPGPNPFVRMVNETAILDPNLEVLTRRFEGAPSSDVVAAGTLRGRILDEPLSLPEAASLLDELRYENHRPTKDGWEGHRWTDLESHVGLDANAGPDHLRPFFRPPPSSETEPTAFVRIGCPYAIAAYLRLWRACLTHKARGLFATNDSRVPWSMLDLDRKAVEQPRFFVGIRYGSGSPTSGSALDRLPFRIAPMKREISGGALTSTWGSRNPGDGPDAYLGDALFDYHFHNLTPPRPAIDGSVWRPAGSPGLLLFHLIERAGMSPAVALGVAIPIGGPDQFAAVVG